jgi:hypothetical protein
MRYVPLVGLCAWFLIVPLIGVSPLIDLGGKRMGLSILSAAGISILLLSMLLGFRVYLKFKKETGLRDRFLSWCIAANAAVFLLFCSFLILIWPIVLKSP